MTNHISTAIGGVVGKLTGEGKQPNTNVGVVEAPEKAFSLTLGAGYRDVVTGYKGRAMSYVEFIGGCVQYGIVPEMKPDDEKVPIGEFFDFQRLVPEDSITTITFDHVQTGIHYDLGAKLREKISGLEGIVTTKCVRFNGLIDYSIQPPGVNKEGGIIDGLHLDSLRLELVPAPVPEVEKVRDNIDPKRPGGPSKRAHLPSRA